MSSVSSRISPAPPNTLRHTSSSLKASRHSTFRRGIQLTVRASGLSEALFQQLTSSPAEPYLQGLKELFLNFTRMLLRLTHRRYVVITTMNKMQRWKPKPSLHNHPSCSSVSTVRRGTTTHSKPPEIDLRRTSNSRVKL